MVVHPRGQVLYASADDQIDVGLENYSWFAEKDATPSLTLVRSPEMKVAVAQFKNPSHMLVPRFIPGTSDNLTRAKLLQFSVKPSRFQNKVI